MEHSANNGSKVLCPFQTQCGLVEVLQEKMPELSQRIYDKYCTKAFLQCARRKIYDQLGPHAVPPLMLPGQTDWARRIIEELDASGENLNAGDTTVEHIKTQ